MCTAEQVHAVLQAYGEPLQYGRIEPLGTAGGLSGARLWRIHTRAGCFALKAYTSEQIAPEHLRFVHAVLEHVHKSGFGKIALPVRTSLGETFVSAGGYLWELSRWMPGQPDIPHCHTPARVRAAMTALAEFHIAAAGFSPSDIRKAQPSLRRKQQSLVHLDKQLPQLAASAADCPHAELRSQALHLLELVREVLPIAREHVSSAAGLNLPLQPCIRDAWCGNVLFEKDQVTAFVDFAMLDLDWVAVDIARLLGSMAGNHLELWQVGLEAYSQVRKLGRDYLSAIIAYDSAIAVLGGVNWIRWTCSERQPHIAPKVAIQRMGLFCDRLSYFREHSAHPAATAILRLSCSEY